jgi:dipeptidyl aminopeptidase/acylaminoacyl peptidase
MRSRMTLSAVSALLLLVGCSDGKRSSVPASGRIVFDNFRDVWTVKADGTGLTRLTRSRKPDFDAVWSPDGARIAFRSERSGDSEIWLMHADGSGQHRLARGLSPAWSPDGSRIVVTSARSDDWDIDVVTDLYVVDASGGEPEVLTGSDGMSEAASWSPDGTRIAHRFAPIRMGDEPYHGQIAVIDLATRERIILTASLDRNCSPYPPLREPIWEGEDLLFGVEDRGNVHVYRVAADGSGKPEAVTEGERWVAGYDARDGALIHVVTDPTSLPELYAGDRRLTNVGRAFTDGRRIVAPERFVATSADGSDVEAWIVRPADFEPGRRYPALLNIHGGPFTQYGNRFFDEFQVYAAAGYVVLYSNPRGSSGYSEAWGRAIRGPVADGPGWGTVDYEDCMAVVNEAVRRFDFIDANRLGVMGGSYGGFMTSWIVGHTDRFKAACSERALNDWPTFFASSDFGWFVNSYVGEVWPWEDMDTYLKLSPTTYAPNIHTPVLIIHSEEDLRCPIDQGEYLFTILRLLKREVEFLRFPSESHELSRSGSPLHRVKRFDAILEWFGRHLDPSLR